jgi:predicted 2-oxoglutarate/Fe(II)-dependent dioxygenase YbiX
MVLIPAVFDPDECLGLIDCFDRSEAVQSKLRDPSGEEGGGAADGYKSRLDVTVESPLREVLGERLLRHVVPGVRDAFGFEPSGLEAPKLVRYDAGRGRFGPHRDNATPVCTHRRVAITCNLNAGRYQGGRLAFPELDTPPLDPPKGAVLAFDAGLVHEVRLVTAGQRYALLTFLF